MQRTRIEWVVNPDGTQGYTFNPVIGCQHGCEYCYAKKMNDRYKWIEDWEKPIVKSGQQPLLIMGKPKTIFIGSMTDLFGDWVQNEFIENILQICRENERHAFLFLTKNSRRYKEFKFPDNCFLGVTVTRPYSVYIDGNNWNFISYEPLLENIRYCSMVGVKWIIIGALNKNGRIVKPEQGGTKAEWVYNLIEVATKHNVPVFIKDSLLNYYLHLPLLRELPYLKHIPIVGKERRLCEDN